jgi:hypothetical protein
MTKTQVKWTGRLRAALATFALAGLATGCENMNLDLSSLGDVLGGGGSSQQSSAGAPPATGGAAAAPAGGSATPVTLASMRAADERLLQSRDITPYTFDTDPAGATPAGWVAASTRAPGKWIVTPANDAPTPPNVLAQVDGSAGTRYNALLREAPITRRQNKMRTRIKIGPEGARAAGLVFNVEGGNPGNGYALILDVAKNQILLERVVDGFGQALRNDHLGGMFGALARPLETNRWYEVEVISDNRRGTRAEIEVTIDGFKAYSASDNRFINAGQAGFLTRDDSRAQFDTFTLNEERDLPAPVVAQPPVEVDDPRCRETLRFNFNDLAEGQSDPRFVSLAGGQNIPGTWVAAANTAANPRTMKQVDGTRDGGRWSLLLYNEAEYVNAEIRADLRTESGERDFRMAGLVFRARDERNHYLAAIDTSKDEVSLIRVANGTRQLIERSTVNLKNDQWYRMTVILEGINITLRLDGDTVIRARDNTFMRGRTGFFTRSDTKAMFDDFKICVLPD